MKDPKMTEQEFISMFKKKGFELYKTKDIKKKLDALHSIVDIAKKVK